MKHIPELPPIKIPMTEKRKSSKITRKLRNMGYDVNDPNEALTVFETCDIDKIQFDFPYGSFDAYKQHVLLHDLDLDLTSNIMTSEESEKIDKAVKEGKLWRTHSPEMKH